MRQVCLTIVQEHLNLGRGQLSIRHIPQEREVKVNKYEVSAPTTVVGMYKGNIRKLHPDPYFHRLTKPSYDCIVIDG